MAQRSLPQAGTGVGDSGPYTSDQWAEFFQAVFTGDQEATQGPLPRLWNELVVSKAVLTITTGTGAGFVYGHWLINDAAVGIDILLAAVGQERYDRVVMIENNSNATYGTNLAYPGGADYEAGGIRQNTARIAILQGAEAAVAVLPDLITGVGGIYMVELARYLVTNAAVGAIDDRRDFCEFSHDEPDMSTDFFVPAVAGWNWTNAIQLSWYGFTTPCAGFYMSNNRVTSVVGHFVVPRDYIGDMEILPIVTPWIDEPGPEGLIYVKMEINYGQCEEDCETHTANWLYRAVDDTFYEKRNCIDFLDYSDLGALTVGDIVCCRFFRDGGDGNDTMDNPILCPGFLVTYMGSQVVHG